MTETASYTMPMLLTGGKDDESRSRPQTGRGYVAPGSARASSPPSSVRSSTRLTRSPSPRSSINANALDGRGIMTLSQQCTEDLSVKMREKNALTDFIGELKRQKMQYDSKNAKKNREVDVTVVQTMEMEKKLRQITNANKLLTAEFNGLRKENENLEEEIENLRRHYKEKSDSYESECEEVDTLKRTLYSYRKEINAESKLRDNVQQDLRASRAAQTLMIQRLDDVAKRNRALRSCVVNTICA